MQKKLLLSLRLVLVFVPISAWAQFPRFLSIARDGTAVWTNPVPGNLAVFEYSTNLAGGLWLPFFYDWGTNGLRTSHLPALIPPSFYRVGVQTSIPDSSLVLHLAFDNEISSGTVLDVSGFGNHGFRYGLTNWPSASFGPDGSFAGKFTRYGAISGDYAGVPYSSNLDNLSQGTLLVWGRYTANSYGATALVDASWWEDSNSWVLGRNYAYNTKFSVESGGVEIPVISYPDQTTDYDTGGWHYYGVSWDGTNFTGYYDGLPISTYPQAAFPKLVLGGNYRWIAIGCRNHDGTPIWGDDEYPNNGWMGGLIDDVRLYRRVLTAAEVLALYGSFDKLPPSSPSNLIARAVSSGQIELR